MKKRITAFIMATMVSLAPFASYAAEPDALDIEPAPQENQQESEVLENEPPVTEPEEVKPSDEQLNNEDKEVSETKQEVEVPAEETETSAKTESEDKGTKEDDEATYTVSFYDSVDEKIFATVDVSENGSVKELPKAPEHEGYEFKEYEGTYTDVMADETVTAVYEAIDTADTEDVLVYAELSETVGDYVISAVGNMPEGTKLVASMIENDSDVEKTVCDSVEGMTFKAQVSFDIKLMDGDKEYQPVESDETVKISINHINSDSDLAVFRITDDGAVTNMNASVSGETVDFVTDHFTTYTVGEIRADGTPYEMVKIKGTYFYAPFHNLTKNERVDIQNENTRFTYSSDTYLSSYIMENFDEYSEDDITNYIKVNRTLPDKNASYKKTNGIYQQFLYTYADYSYMMVSEYNDNNLSGKFYITDSTKIKYKTIKDKSGEWYLLASFDWIGLDNGQYFDLEVNNKTIEYDGQKHGISYQTNLCPAWSMVFPEMYIDENGYFSMKNNFSRSINNFAMVGPSEILKNEWSVNLHSEELIDTGSTPIISEVINRIIGYPKSEKKYTEDVNIEGSSKEYFDKNKNTWKVENTIPKKFTFHPGTLTITKAPLIITTSSATKTDDGKPLTSGEYTVTGLKNGETVGIRVTGSQKGVGSSKNTYKIIWAADDNNYTAKECNYYIAEENLGTLTIEEADKPKSDDNKPDDKKAEETPSKTEETNKPKSDDKKNEAPFEIKPAADPIPAPAPQQTTEESQPVENTKSAEDLTKPVGDVKLPDMTEDATVIGNVTDLQADDAIESSAGQNLRNRKTGDETNVPERLAKIMCAGIVLVSLLAFWKKKKE